MIPHLRHRHISGIRNVDDARALELAGADERPSPLREVLEPTSSQGIAVLGARNLHIALAAAGV